MQRLTIAVFSFNIRCVGPEKKFWNPLLASTISVSPVHTGTRRFYEGTAMNRTGNIRGAWLGKLAGGLAALCLAVVFLTAGPSATARADGYVSFGFGTSFGHGHRHHRYGRYRYGHYRYYGHRYHRHRHYGHRHYGHRHYGHHHHRHSHVTYTRVIPAAPAQQQARTAKPAAAKDASSSCLMIREYQTKITVGGEEVEAYGDACLQPDGSWRLGTPKQVPAG